MYYPSTLTHRHRHTHQSRVTHRPHTEARKKKEKPNSQQQQAAASVSETRSRGTATFTLESSRHLLRILRELLSLYCLHLQRCSDCTASPPSSSVASPAATVADQLLVIL